jgi:hypothetical protein
MNNQQRRKETHAQSVSGHVAQAKAVHEQVTKDKTSIQGRTEAASHSNGHQ